MAQGVPAGHRWSPKTSGVNLHLLHGKNLVRTLVTGTRRGLLVSRGSLQSPFSTTAVYWYGVLPTRVPARAMMAWFPDTIRNNSAARFAPMFVFIDCVPIALVPLAAWK